MRVNLQVYLTTYLSSSNLFKTSKTFKLRKCFSSGEQELLPKNICISCIINKCLFDHLKAFTFFVSIKWNKDIILCIIAYDINVCNSLEKWQQDIYSPSLEKMLEGLITINYFSILSFTLNKNNYNVLTISHCLHNKFTRHSREWVLPTINRRVKETGSWVFWPLKTTNGRVILNWQV